MTTKEKWILSWLFTVGHPEPRGAQDRHRAPDRLLLRQRLHQREGRRAQGRARRTTGSTSAIKIDEGEQYNVGDIKFAGDVPPTTEEETQLFGTSRPRRARSSAPASCARTSPSSPTSYGDEGYAFVNVEPETLIRAEEKTVDVTFRMSRGRPVTIDKIEITGNTKTRDKVIRRELKIGEQEQFSATKLRKSRDALHRLGFFSDVNLTTRKATARRQDQRPGRRQGRLDRLVQRRRRLQLGRPVPVQRPRLREQSLRPRPARRLERRLRLDPAQHLPRASPSPTSSTPSCWARRRSTTPQLEFNDFTRGSTGFSLRGLYPLEALGLDHRRPARRSRTRASASSTASRRARSSTSRPARRRASSPSRARLTISIARAELLAQHPEPRLRSDRAARSRRSRSSTPASAADANFYRVEARGRWFFPIYKIPDLGTLRVLHRRHDRLRQGRVGLSGNELPLFERYFPGGINSVRGYETRTLGPRENVFNAAGRQHQQRADRRQPTQLIVNNEIIFPIVAAARPERRRVLRRRQLVPAGSTASTSATCATRSAAASAGSRRFGPLRIEFGIPAQPHERARGRAPSCSRSALRSERKTKERRRNDCIL